MSYRVPKEKKSASPTLHRKVEPAGLKNSGRSPVNGPPGTKMYVSKLPAKLVKSVRNDPGRSDSTSAISSTTLATSSTSSTAQASPLQQVKKAPVKPGRAADTSPIPVPNGQSAKASTRTRLAPETAKTNPRRQAYAELHARNGEVLVGETMTADPDGPKVFSTRVQERHAAISSPRKIQDADVEKLLVKAKAARLIDRQLDNVLDYLNQPESLSVQGLHRISGRAKELELATTRFLKGELVAYPVVGDPLGAVNDASGFLKLLFKTPYSLGDTLIPLRLQQQMVDQVCAMKQTNDNDIGQLANWFMNSMPKTNKEAFEKILKHLASVARNSEVNLMGAANLGIVFGTKFYDAVTLNPMTLASKSRVFACVMTELIEREMKPHTSC